MAARAQFAYRGRCPRCSCRVTVICYDSAARALLRRDAKTCPNCEITLAPEELPAEFVQRCLLGQQEQEQEDDRHEAT